MTELFMDYVSPEPNSGCWLWTGAVNNHGYGVKWRNGKNHYAHRLMYEDVSGPIPDGHIVMHRCDNPCCVNPDHLSLGTMRDNSQDMVRKGRNDPGLGRQPQPNVPRYPNGRKKYDQRKKT